MARFATGKAARFAVFAVWLGFVAWLIRFEAYPELFTDTIAGYRNLVTRDLLQQDNWSRIFFRGTPIGYAHTSMDIQEDDPARYYVIRSEMELRLTAMGRQLDLAVDLTVNLNAVQALHSFEFDMKADPYRTRIRATRMDGERYRMSIQSAGETRTSVITIPDDVVLDSPVTELAMKALTPGKSLTLRILDPATMGTAAMTVTALREETITVGGSNCLAKALATDYQGIRFLSWMGADGRMLRQDTPFGWTIEASTADEAIAAMKKTGRSDDLLAALAVPCVGTIPNPRASRELKLRLTGVSLGEEDLPSPRQRILLATNTTTEIVVVRSYYPAPGANAPAPDRSYLAASTMIQSDHADIRRQAAAITKGLSDPAAKARAIAEWVYREIKKEMAASLPSALDVLRARRGDCNEHTYLFVALARAAGLPAAVKVGLAWHENAFYYHAWPAVFAGDWVEVEPTWGEETVDATHLALAEGELASQMRILKAIGRLKIEVIEAR
jgi:hypothetical protein